MVDLSGKIALVTGSSRGIGRQIALEMAQAGADVAVHYYAIDSSNRVMAEEAAHEIVSSGRRALVVSGDVSDSEAVKDIVKQTEDELEGRRGLDVHVPLRADPCDGTVAHPDGGRARY